VRRWVGIDEAGYGPNLGPLVMTAVVAESGDDRERGPDLWADQAEHVCRAGGPADKLWVDDSKAIFGGRKGRERLEEAALAAITATGAQVPTSLAALYASVTAGSLDQVEVSRWVQHDPGLQVVGPRSSCALRCEHWRIVAVRSVVMGPERFNRGLARSESKAVVHFGAFAELLGWVWETSSLEVPTLVRGDKHGGRNFYAGPLADALPDSWVMPEVEGPALSRYGARGTDRTLTVEFLPRADANDGLVALASIVSKLLREVWMDAFNAFWCERVPGLAPSAGYPVDATRFRREVGRVADELGLPLELWWRHR